MKSVDDHLQDVLNTVTPLSPLDLQLLDAQGCILAEEVVASQDLPAFDNSAMDGYAVCVKDVAHASSDFPVVLPVIGDVAAGTSEIPRLTSGFTVRVMTGAPVPLGTEAVVPHEWTDAGVRQVAIRRAPEAGQFIRQRGEDVESGETVLRGGARLGATQIGLLAAIGREMVRIRPRPRVVIVSTGNELVEPGGTAGTGQIADANSFTLTAAAREAGAVPYRVGIVPDDPRRLLSTVEDQLIRADLVVTTGGVSVGAYDVVKEVLNRLGTVRFDGVAMQPGMPQGFGTIGPDATPIFALPGNPVSAYVSFEVFVRPAIRRMLGVEPLHRPVVTAACQESFPSPEGKLQFARAWLSEEKGKRYVWPLGGSGSHLLGDLAQANALIIVPEAATEVQAGTNVAVMVLERRTS